MKTLLDLAPLAAFFVAWLAGGIYVATAALVAACLIQCAVLKAVYGKVERMNIAVCVLTVALGGLTLALQNDAFIKIKPTVVYTVFAAGLLAADFLFGRNAVQLLMGKFFAVPDSVWRKASCGWAGFFLCVALFNLWAAGLSEAAWVKIKTFGYPAATFAFAIAQVAMVSVKDAGAKKAGGGSGGGSGESCGDGSLRARVAEKLSALNPVELEVLDESAKHRGHREAGSGAHFQVRVVSERFAGLSRLQRHRLVYETVGKPADLGLHALAVRALAPDEVRPAHPASSTSSPPSSQGDHPS